jgi:hypothetical protein
MEVASHRGRDVAEHAERAQASNAALRIQTLAAIATRRWRYPMTYTQPCCPVEKLGAMSAKRTPEGIVTSPTSVGG